MRLTKDQAYILIRGHEMTDCWEKCACGKTYHIYHDLVLGNCLDCEEE